MSGQTVAEKELAEERARKEQARLELHAKRLAEQEKLEEERRAAQAAVEECEACGKPRSGTGGCKYCGYYKPWKSKAPVRRSDGDLKV